MKNTLLTLIAGIFLTQLGFAEILTISDKKGRTMIVELVSRQGEKVVIKRLKDNKTFTIDPSTLSEESQQEIKEKLQEVKEAYPPIDATVVVSKRRKSENSSYYMKEMTISSKVTLTNEDSNVLSPTCQCNILFIGQNQRYSDRFVVLANESFKLTPAHQGSDFNSPPTVTSYDSDNKGSGNIGGYKYVGYLLVVSDQERKSIILTKTVYSAIKKAMAANTRLAGTMRDYKVGTYLNKAMVEASASKTRTRY
ncbi:hypothetical protein HW115_10955 [Verrucomicrobiaceae bacterium N1E253]|uniref:Uncharacterized protein n=1 Tax=Oceaniferula marina TaxID=2748318 RepID=A0A851GMS5_9BACT|nr:hypothetical protein [Oceaniferula marina]NWK56130.1 hypothetical protein [Oceaniferula marina]